MSRDLQGSWANNFIYKYICIPVFEITYTQGHSKTYVDDLW